MKTQSMIIVSAFLALASGVRVRRADDDSDLDLTPINRRVEVSDARENINLDPQVEPLSCKLPDGRDGKCFDESACTEDHIFRPGGVIDSIERRNNNCPGLFDWCCVVL